MREWLSGRASPCQGEGREFESRFALLNGSSRKTWTFLLRRRCKVMMVGTCEVTLRIPWALSLKDKRMVVKSLVEKTRHKFNISIAEVDKHVNLSRFLKHSVQTCMPSMCVADDQYSHNIPSPNFSLRISLIARSAFPLWLSSFFCSGVICAVVHPYSGT